MFLKAVGMVKIRWGCYQNLKPAFGKLGTLEVDMTEFKIFLSLVIMIPRASKS